MNGTATTMLGLAVAAASIGFNATQWPIVEQRVAAVERASPEESAASPTPSEQPARPPAAQPANPSPALPALPLVKPVPDVERTGGDNPPPNRATPADNAAPSDDGRSSGTIRQEQPLVPVPEMHAPAGGAAYDGKVRRLPPVDPGQPSPVVIGQPSPYGSIPVYPSTGIQ